MIWIRLLLFKVFKAEKLKRDVALDSGAAEKIALEKQLSTVCHWVVEQLSANADEMHNLLSQCTEEEDLTAFCHSIIVVFMLMGIAIIVS